MSVINELATALHRRDEIPNLELAGKIVQSRDKNAVKELVENLSNKDKNIQADCIKVLYEIGAVQPGLIKPYLDDFVALLHSKKNRLVWGGMTALYYLTSEEPATIYKLLPELIHAADAGSVITRDNLVRILVRLEELKAYQGKAFPLLMEQLMTCPPNQLPMYAEDALAIVNHKNKATFIEVLQQRIPEIESAPKQKRILKVIKTTNAL